MTQIRADNQPVTQVTVVDSEPDKQAEALSVMTDRALYGAPARVSISLHRSLDGGASSTTSSGKIAAPLARPTPSGPPFQPA